MRFPSAIILLLFLHWHAPAADAPLTNSLLAADLKKFQVAPGLKLEVVAAEPLLQNPVCFSIDARGRFFVVETHRYRTAIFDITANTPWLLDDLSFRTVPDRAAFLARTFATNLAVLTNQSELVRLVEDRDGDGRAETSSVFATGFNETVSGTAAGVLAQGTNVWVTSIPDLWRMGPDEFRMTNRTPASSLSSATLQKLATGLGVHISVSGHDVHGLILGPDGRLYFSFGDRGVCVTNREGALVNVPDTGGVLRCEPDGRNLEIFCTGLRNPQELAFDDLGNLWTVDNDTAGADPCRVLHLIEGGDYGWRMSYQHMKGFGPWVQEELWRGGLDGVLPPAGTVSQGPAGLAFSPGSGAGERFAGKFVHADFPGGIWAYSVKPRGASYEVADKEKILWNCWPTDVDFGPDGALYVLDWVQGWNPPGQGRIYRLTSTTNAANERGAVEVKRLLGEGMSPRGEKELLALLGHGDRRVRLEAQWELAARGTNSLPGLIKTAGDNRTQLARLHALWGFRQILRTLPRSQGAAELAALLPLLDDANPELRGQAALALGEGRLFNAERPVARLLEDSSLRTRLLALQAVNLRWHDEFVGKNRGAKDRVYFSNYQKTAGAAATVIEKLIGARPLTVSEKVGAAIAGHFPLNKIAEVFPNNSGDLYFQSAATLLLANTWTPQGAFHSWFPKANSVEARTAAALTCRRLTNALLAPFLQDASPRVVLETARAINDAGISAAYPNLAALLEDARFRDPNWGWSALSNLTPAGPFSAKVRPPREQVLRRVLNANFRLGERTNAGALVRFALGAPVAEPARAKPNEVRAGSETGAPDQLRAEALFLLGAWEILPARVGDLPIKPTKDPNHGAVPTVNPENWPGWFDRVVGFWRPLPPRPADTARAVLAPHIASLIADASEEVATAATHAALQLRLTNAAPALLARLQDVRSPAALRARVPAALAGLDAPELAHATEIALADADPAVRASAVPHLGRLNGDRATEILGRIVSAPDHRSEGELRLAQAALTALGKISTPAAGEILRAALTKLMAGQWPGALELELVEAAATRPEPATQALLTQRTARQPTNDLIAAWRFTLEGGEAARGRAVFFEKVEVQCSRCHQVKKEGGIVGPPLDGIGRRLSRAQLLESILLPNQTITVGFENVALALRDGRTVAGLVKSETATELVLDSPEEGVLKIVQADITARQRGLSAMPEELGRALSAREVRDLVQFLSALR